ncbi:MAG: ERF family protein [Wenzhouxiangella sp.]|jgi:hypothetical protein|nr:ERF family protein [Wenzhouxiangella sp.]
MRTSVSTDQIFKARREVGRKVRGVVADAVNDHFNHKYATLEGILNVLREPLDDCGLVIMQHPVSDENGVGIETRLMHESGEWIEQHFTLPLGKPDPQKGASAISYARRYAITALFQLPTLDDDGNEAADPGPATITDQQAGELLQMAEQAGLSEDQLTAWLKVPAVGDLPVGGFQRAVSALKARIAKQRGGAE